MLYISPTFLDSFRRYKNMESGEASDAMRLELLERLRGVMRPPNEAMQRGIDFEDDVCAACDMRYTPKTPDYDMYVREVADFVRGARRQIHVEREIMSGISIHGYIDFLLPGLVVDTKTTLAYEWGKYLHNCQHLAYLYALKPEGITRFEYVVTDFKGVYHEKYDWTPAMDDELRSRIYGWLDYLETDSEMKAAFIAREAVRGIKL
jgi:hypothetical protein